MTILIKLQFGIWCSGRRHSRDKITVSLFYLTVESAECGTQKKRQREVDNNRSLNYQASKTEKSTTIPSSRRRNDTVSAQCDGKSHRRHITWSVLQHHGGESWFMSSYFFPTFSLVECNRCSQLTHTMLALWQRIIKEQKKSFVNKAWGSETSQQILLGLTFFVSPTDRALIKYLASNSEGKKQKKKTK